MADHRAKIAAFVTNRRTALESGNKPPFNHLNSILRQCGWKNRGPRNLEIIQEALEAEKVFPEPILTARGLATDELIFYGLKKPPRYVPEEYEPRLSFSSEAELSRFLVRNFGRIQEFNGFKKPIREYLLPSGKRMDILCRRRGSDDFVVIELKRGSANPVGQLLGYMHEVQQELAKPSGAETEGVIVSAVRNTILEEAMRGQIKRYPVQWLNYKVDMKLRESG